jgi:hypothetical protein
MTQVTQSLTWQASAGTTGPIRLRQGGTNHSFFTNMWLCEPHVCEKDKKSTMLPQAILLCTG